MRDLAALKPFFSICVIIGTLFVLVFMQMEERRIGYSLLKLSREQKEIVEEKRVKTMQLAKLTRPQQVEKFVQNRSSLKKMNSSQIIHLSGSVGSNN